MNLLPCIAFDTIEETIDTPVEKPRTPNSDHCQNIISIDDEPRPNTDFPNLDEDE